MREGQLSHNQSRVFHCGSDHFARNSSTQSWQQRHLYFECGRTSLDQPQSNAYTPKQRERILRAYPMSAAVCAVCSCRHATVTFGQIILSKESFSLIYYLEAALCVRPLIMVSIFLIINWGEKQSCTCLYPLSANSCHNA